MSGLNVGDAVEALHRDGEWYPAEVVKVSAGTYKVLWFDGDGSSRFEHARVRKLNTKVPAQHRYCLGDEVLAFANGGWWNGTVIGLCAYGYHIKWYDDSEGRSIERSTLSKPADGHTPPRLKVGDSVTAYSEEDEGWFPAVVCSIMRDGCEVNWSDGSRSRIPLGGIIPGPLDEFPQKLEGAPRATPSLNAMEAVVSSPTRDLPLNDQRHSPSLVEQKPPREAQNTPSWFQSLLSSTEVRVTALPPFVEVRIRSRKRR